MLLSEEQIKSIVLQTLKTMENKQNGHRINQIELSEKEALDLIQTYIYEKKGIDIGNIESPAMTLKQFGEVAGMVVQQRYGMMNHAVDVCLKYYNNKFKENV